MSYDARAINEALAQIRDIATATGYDAEVHLVHDGRVIIHFLNLGGYVKATVRADLVPGGAHKPPGEALAEYAAANGIRWAT